MYNDHVTAAQKTWLRALDQKNFAKGFSAGTSESSGVVIT
jgi:hypothetical protein